MRVMVTGAAGFLGSYVAEALKAVGHDVVAFDIVEPRLEIEHIKGDLRSIDDVVTATKGVDAVCHLGAIGDVYLALEKPYLAAEVNVVGTTNVMEACLRNDVVKVVYASTWEVYDELEYEPIDENHPCRPMHPYNITKLAGERIAFSYDKLKGVQAIALRLSTAYGRHMRPNSVFSIFINKALRNEPIIIQGTGEQYRLFTHGSDIAEAFLLALESDIRMEAFNIVTDEAVSIKQLAEYVNEVIPTEIIYTEARVGDIPSAKVSSDKAKKILGWKPQMSFRDGLHDLISWVKESGDLETVKTE